MPLQQLVPLAASLLLPQLALLLWLHSLSASLKAEPLPLPLPLQKLSQQAFRQAPMYRHQDHFPQAFQVFQWNHSSSVA
jgi:hypothetical protein